jgi:hypothetical protein
MMGAFGILGGFLRSVGAGRVDVSPSEMSHVPKWPLFGNS